MNVRTTTAPMPATVTAILLTRRRGPVIVFRDDLELERRDAVADRLIDEYVASRGERSIA